MDANIAEKKEEEFVRKFAEKGLAFRTVLGPPKITREVVARSPINPDAIYEQYKSIKQSLGK